MSVVAGVVSFYLVFMRGLEPDPTQTVVQSVVFDLGLSCPEQTDSIATVRYIEIFNCDVGTVNAEDRPRARGGIDQLARSVHQIKYGFSIHEIGYIDLVVEV